MCNIVRIFLFRHALPVELALRTNKFKHHFMRGQKGRDVGFDKVKLPTIDPSVNKIDLDPWKKNRSAYAFSVKLFRLIQVN